MTCPLVNAAILAPGFIITHSLEVKIKTENGRELEHLFLL